MQRYLYRLAVPCLFANLAWGSNIFVYQDPSNGTTVAPKVGATNAGGYLSTSWIFGEVTPIPGYTGQPMWANEVGITILGPNPITFGVFTGVWAADGANGGPGTLLDEGQTIAVTFPTGDHILFVYSNFAIPAGSFWMGYCFENLQTLSTTAAELDQFRFDLAGPPTVGSTSTVGLLGSAIGGLGSNPAISGPVRGNLAQNIEFFAPEPAPAGLLMAGLVGIAAFRLRKHCRFRLPGRSNGRKTIYRVLLAYSTHMKSYECFK